MSASEGDQMADDEASLPNEAEDGDRDYVASLARGLEVICAFTRDTPSMTLSDVVTSRCGPRCCSSAIPLCPRSAFWTSFSR